MNCASTFLQSPTLGRILSTDRDSWLAIEELDQIDVEGVSVWVKLDFALTRDGVTHLFDWKTGKSGSADPGHLEQLAVYSLYAMQKWGAEVDSVKVHLLYLSDHQLATHQISPESILEAKEFILSGAETMRNLLEGDPEENKPQPMSAFPKIDDSRECGFCCFREICHDQPSVLS